MYFRQFFLNSIIFPHAKFTENQEFASLTFLNEVLSLYWQHNDPLYTKGFYCKEYLFM